MNKFERFFRRYIFSTVGIILLFLFVNILLVASFFVIAYLGNVKNSNFRLRIFQNISRKRTASSMQTHGQKGS